MNYFILALILFPIITHTNEFRSYPPELTQAVERISQLPEARSLIQKAARSGPISLRLMNPDKCQFQGLWESGSRTIYINVNEQKTLGKQIQTLLFELHNAISNAFFHQLWIDAQIGRIDKQSFVEKAERFEYNNLIQTQTLIEKGIAQKIFPPDSRFDLFPEFRLHYFFQQLCDHSEWFSDQFDKCCPSTNRKPYYGTIKNLLTLSSADRKDLARYIQMCRRMSVEFPSTSAFEAIEKEREELKCCLAGTADASVNCRRAARRLELLQDVFKNF